MQNVQDELDILRSQSDNVGAVQDEVLELRQRLVSIQNELNQNMGENERLLDELSRQQSLYNELKKMRGRGEEMDMLQELEQVNMCAAHSTKRRTRHKKRKRHKKRTKHKKLTKHKKAHSVQKGTDGSTMHAW